MINLITIKQLHSNPNKSDVVCDKHLKMSLSVVVTAILLSGKSHDN